MDEKQRIPLWIPGFFLYHVLPDAMEHILGIFRRTGFKAVCCAYMDVSATMALGISRYTVPYRCGSVCLWILQCDADINSPWICYYGSIQASQLVCLLSNGNHDPADL